MKHRYRIHYITGYPFWVIRKMVFKIFPTYIYFYLWNGEISEGKSDWFQWVNADYYCNNGKWILSGHSPILSA